MVEIYLNQFISVYVQYINLWPSVLMSHFNLKNNPVIHNIKANVVIKRTKYKINALYGM